MKHINKILLPAFLIISMVSCKKSELDTAPSNGVLPGQILATTGSITSVLDGAYKGLFAFGANGNGGHDNFGQKAVDIVEDLAGIDMVVNSAGYGWFNRDYQYTEWTLIDGTNRHTDMYWFLYYNLIKQANQILEQIDATAGTQTEKDLIKGQALGLRAYAYYYLINLFQQTYKGNESKPGVPLYTKSSIEGKARGTVAEVYTQIIADLTQAETLLTGKTVASKNNMNVNVVQGFRARVALLMEDWPTAATYAAKAKTGYTLMTPSQYNATTAFSSINGPEVMWGSLIPSAEATIYASFFSHMDVATGGYASLGTQKKITKALYDQIPVGDARKNGFTPITSTSTTNPPYNQIKERVPVPGSWAADYIYMRASEMYLIEAEADARAGQDGPARTALETIVKARYPAYSAASFSGPTLIAEILLQRRIELWGEGFSLIDIKRLKTGLNRPTGAGNHGSPNLDANVYTMADGDPRMIMRIPKREMDNNPALTPADQNP